MVAVVAAAGFDEYVNADVLVGFDFVVDNIDFDYLVQLLNHKHHLPDQYQQWNQPVED